MARICYPSIKIPGTSLAGDPTAYWDFCALDTAGQGTQPPVAWTHGAAVTLDNDGTPECVTPAAYYNQNAAAKSEQASTLYRNGTATWFFVFRQDGAVTVNTCVACKASPGTTGDSQYGFVLTTNATQVWSHLKAGASTEVGAYRTIAAANTIIAAAFSFDASNFRLSVNGTATGEAATPTGFSVGNYPLVAGNRTDTYWGIYKGHIMRVATWQGIAATAAEMNKLTALFADGCTPGFLQSNAMMFSCNT